MEHNQGASPDGDRATDASHGASCTSPPSGSVSTCAALCALADRCERAPNRADRELDATIHAFIDGYTAVEERQGWIVAVGKGVMERSLGLIDPGKHTRNFTPQHHDTPAYTGSLDAAVTLVPKAAAQSPGEHWNVEKWVKQSAHPSHVMATAWVYGAPRAYAATPALALCAAALKARAAIADTHAKRGDSTEIEAPSLMSGGDAEGNRT